MKRNSLLFATALPIYSGYDVNFLDTQLQREDKSYIDSLHPNPPALQLGQRYLCSIYDWTSGFFPGSLWYAYEMTGDEELKNRAIEYTNLLNPIRELKGTHDIGFMMNCSYGNALRLAPNDTIKAVLIETADNLCSRFNPEIGCIRSWDFGEWNFPVIIDNMMNLDLLFNVSKLTGDNKYKDIAVKHAQTTMKNHFRPDYTSYHVVSYNNDGSVEVKQTHQGKNAESAWSRGQAWGVYGYTSCYRETQDVAFLQEAIHIADMIMERVKTDDLIPYWDYDARKNATRRIGRSHYGIRILRTQHVRARRQEICRLCRDYIEKSFRSRLSVCQRQQPGLCADALHRLTAAWFRDRCTAELC